MERAGSSDGGALARHLKVEELKPGHLPPQSTYSPVLLPTRCIADHIRAGARRWTRAVSITVPHGWKNGVSVLIA